MSTRDEPSKIAQLFFLSNSQTAMKYNQNIENFNLAMGRSVNNDRNSCEARLVPDFFLIVHKTIKIVLHLLHIVIFFVCQRQFSLTNYFNDNVHWATILVICFLDWNS